MAEEPKGGLLLHACCGPCSIEPLRCLREEGYDIQIAFVNPNIEPDAEYRRRLDTLMRWAALVDVPVHEGPCDRDLWEREVAVWGTRRGPRCAACYALRLRQSASMARELGLPALSTTLAVSPYQLFEACSEALRRACAEAGLQRVWRDFRPLYPQATAESKRLGMYRQNCCGCRFSAAEAAFERTGAREARRMQRELERAQKLATG